jgi:Big-like domain-containing protein
VAFHITCGSTTGSIRVTTATSGDNPDDGYTFAIDAGAPHSIGASDNQSVGDIPAGSHSVVLSGIAGNCSADDASKNVSVTAGQTADVAFSITCTSTAPDASESEMRADPKNIDTGENSTIRVTVRDANGRRMSGIQVSVSSTGTGNTITPGSQATDSRGEAVFTFSSTVGEDKTITATAGGVTLNDTEVIVVSRRNSSIAITSDQNDPSTSGETITVTFTVTVQGGGTPTGTVDIFSLEEAQVGCTVDVSLGQCTFALNTVGVHHLQASYSGDAQFNDSLDPDGEDHTVAPAAP